MTRYVGYYGASLLSKSHMVFFVSLAAHLMQLAFLVFVESPHMEKIYGSDRPRDRACHDQIFCFHTNFRKPAHLHTLVLVTLCSMLYVFGSFSSSFVFLQCLLARTVHVLMSGVILKGEDSSQAFSRIFTEAGQTKEEAFEYWKAYPRCFPSDSDAPCSLYNLSLSFGHLSFIMAALHLYNPSSDQPAATMALCHVLGLVIRPAIRIELDR